MDRITDNIEWIGGHIAWIAYWVFGSIHDFATETLPLTIGVLGAVVLMYMNYQKAMKYRAEKRYFEHKRNFFSKQSDDGKNQPSNSEGSK